MFDIGWMELMVIGVVALIVVGPKDMPEMFRQIGRFTAKLRQMAREFSRAMEQAANESGVNEVRKDLNSLARPLSGGIDSLKSAADRFEKWDPVKSATKPAAPKAATPAAAASASPAPAAPAAAAPEARALGPETAALAAKKAAKRVAAKGAAAAEAATPAATVPAAPARKRGGRTRAAASAPKDSA